MVVVMSVVSAVSGSDAQAERDLLPLLQASSFKSQSPRPFEF